LLYSVEFSSCRVGEFKSTKRCAAHASRFYSHRCKKLKSEAHLKSENLRTVSQTSVKFNNRIRLRLATGFRCCLCWYCFEHELMLIELLTN